MAREPISINGKQFKTKKEAEEHFRQLLKRAVNKRPIDGEDEHDLRSLLTRHPNVESKVGVGVAGFFADDAIHGTRCFFIRRLDESTTDFSFITCVKERAPTPHQEFLQAARSSVQKELRLAKERHFNKNKDDSGQLECELTGQPLSLSDAHLDHAEPMTFEVIVKAFLVSRGIEDPAVHVTPPTDNQFEPSFLSSELAQAFRDFHQKMAQLRWVSKAKNLSLGGKHQLRHRKATVSLE